MKRYLPPLLACLMAVASPPTALAFFDIDDLSAASTEAPPKDAVYYRSQVNRAEKGSVNAMVQLGQIFERGEFVPIDPARAGQWYRKAAERGSKQGRAALARLGKPGTKPPSSSLADVVEYRAALGDIEANFRMGTFREVGYGVHASESLAIQHYKKAAQAGHADAITTLRQLVGESTSYRERTPPGDDSAKVYALKQAAYGGNADALFAMAQRSEYVGTRTDMFKAAAERGHDGAIKWLRSHNDGQ